MSVLPEQDRGASHNSSPSSGFASYILQHMCPSMAEQENGLFAIEVDADDYAETAAGDTPSVSRTYQSEANFKSIQATYSAKRDGGKTYEDLISAVPILNQPANASDQMNGHSRVRLSKKDVQLLGYAVGELYYDREFLWILNLCGRVKEYCDVDAKTKESLNRWESRCRERMG